MSRPDRISLLSGLAFVVIGVLLVLDQSGDLDLTPGLAGAALAALVGTILIATGFDERSRRR